MSKLKVIPTASDRAFLVCLEAQLDWIMAHEKEFGPSERLEELRASVYRLIALVWDKD
jgi:hypothetical protein